MTGGNLYLKVDHIKVIVKQLTAHIEHNLDRHKAGTLTNLTVIALKKNCDSVMKENGLYNRKDKQTGAV